MTGRYKAYANYENCEIDYVNELPKGWTTSKVRHISSFGRGLSITKANLKDTGIPCVSYGEVHSKFGFEVDPNKHPLKCVEPEYLNTSSFALLSKGDFIFADTSEDIEGSGNFTQLVSDETLFAGYHTVVVRPRTENYYRFLAYLFDSAEFRTQIRNAVKGVKVFSVTQAILKDADVWLPSYVEQQKIANFLDHETAKIDILITKQEKLIELLKEKRQAVISHAVTKGLNLDAPMKDSGVEWLGEVPEHWNIPKLIQLTSRIGDGLHSTPKYADDTGYYFVNGNNLKDGSIVISNTAKEVPEDEYKKHIVSLGDGTVLLSINGTIGSVALYNNESIILGKSAAYINCEASLRRDFLMRYLQSSNASRYYDLEVTGTTISNLSLNSIRQMKVALPPLQEQIDIAEYCETQIKKYDDLIDKANKLILFIKERKTALISAAVTGKIDVRDFTLKDGEAN